MHTIIKQNPIIAILRNISNEDLIPYMQSIYNGGIHTFEISFSNSTASSQIKYAKSNMPCDALIGAGTVLTVEDAKKAQEAGADFMLSPATSPDVLKYCTEYHIPFLPGAFTPTDVSVCLEYGYSTIKLFPANSASLSYRKSLNGPFPSAEFVAVGGISPQNALDYLKSGYIGVGIGSSLSDPEEFSNKNWDKICSSTKSFVENLRKEYSYENCSC